MLVIHGNCVFWRSKRQDIIAGDTTEAELIGMSIAANELMWLKKFCTDVPANAACGARACSGCDRHCMP